MSERRIYMNLSDGSTCHGGPVDVALDAAAPPQLRQQAEAALAAGGWGPGDDIVVEVQP